MIIFESNNKNTLIKDIGEKDSRQHRNYKHKIILKKRKKNKLDKNFSAKFKIQDGWSYFRKEAE